MSEPEIALLLSTYQRPKHLRRSLESIATQQGVDGKMELIVTDDGSTDETPQVVEQFRRSVNFPVVFTTHPHTTFRLSRCRNEGAKASQAPYLLFLDGDCVFPRNHVQSHLDRRKAGTVMAGDFYRLNKDTSSRITSEAIHSGEFIHWAPKSEIKRLRKLDLIARFHSLIHHPKKPKLFGNNVGIWREDFERINGYDENFQGWGCEDDDLRNRLRKAGVQIESILRWTRSYHLWHPIDVTQPPTWKQGANVSYLLRKGRLTRCRNGLEKRGLEDLSIQVVGRPSKPQAAARLIDGRFELKSSRKPEVEILFLPGEGRFSGQAECNVLVALEPEAAKSRLARHADLMIAPPGSDAFDRAAHFPLDQFEEALGAVA